MNRKKSQHKIMFWGKIIPLIQQHVISSEYVTPES